MVGVTHGTMKPSFEVCAGYLRKLGVEYHQGYEYRGKPGVDRKSYNLDLFYSVKLPLTPQGWCDIAMGEGRDYIGGCCGTASAAQDIVNHTFRHGSGWLMMHEYAELAEILSKHDKTDGIYTFHRLPYPLAKCVDEAHERWESTSPWERVSLVWHIVRHHYEPSVPRAHREDRPEVERAISTLANGLHALSVEHLFNQDLDEPAHAQRRASRAALLAKIGPPLRTLHQRFCDLDPGAVEGFAMIDLEKGPDAITSNGRGMCIFERREHVDELLALWRESETQYKERTHVKPIDERIGVRRVRVSMEHGVEFLD